MKAFLNKHHKPALGIVLLLPAFITIVLTILFPALWNFYLSFYSWDGFSEATWNGMSNYQRILNHRVTMLSFRNSVFIAVVVTVFATMMGMIFAFLVMRMKRREGAFYRLVLFTPVMLPMAVVGLLFSLLYNFEIGLFNSFLRLIGFDGLARAWLAEPETVLGAISFTATWRMWGLTMMLVYTAIMAVPADLFDACEIDGCGHFKRIYMIILPLIRPTIQTSVMLTLAFAFRSYDIVFIMTRGGPGTLSTIAPLQMLTWGFQFNEFGTAAAVGTTFTFLVMAAVFVIQKLLRSDVYEY